MKGNCSRYCLENCEIDDKSEAALKVKTRFDESNNVKQELLNALSEQSYYGKETHNFAIGEIIVDHHDPCVT